VSGYVYIIGGAVIFWRGVLLTFEGHVRNRINSAIEGALEKAFPGAAVLVKHGTPEMKWIEVD
jgi:hypothetical protein